LLQRDLGDSESVQILLLKEHSFLGIAQTQDLTRVNGREIGLRRRRQVLQGFKRWFSEVTSAKIEGDGIHPRNNHTRAAKLFNAFPTAYPSRLGGFTCGVAEDAS